MSHLQLLLILHLQDSVMMFLQWEKKDQLIIAFYLITFSMENSRLTRGNLHSPVKKQNYANLEEEKRYILKKLHYLFVVYASKASRYAYRQITQTYFMELIADTYESAGRQLYKNSTEWKSIVTLYHCKGKKNGMYYDQFLKLLPSIGTYFSRSHDSDNDLKYLIKHLLLVYSNKIYVEFDPSIKQDTQEYIGKLANNLYIIYKIYFPQQINNQFANSEKPQFEAFDNLVTFFKEFQIFPKVISACHLYLIFTEVMQNEQQNMFTWADYEQKKRLGDKGVVLKFSKFIDMLVQVSRVSARKIRQIQNPEWQVEKQKSSLKALLEYMESIKMKDKNKKFKQVRFSFLLVEEYITEADKWMGMIIDPTLKEGTKSNTFFDMFERMKL